MTPELEQRAEGVLAVLNGLDLVEAVDVLAFVNYYLVCEYVPADSIGLFISRMRESLELTELDATRVTGPGH